MLECDVFMGFGEQSTAWEEGRGRGGQLDSRGLGVLLATGVLRTD